MKKNQYVVVSVPVKDLEESINGYANNNDLELVSTLPEKEPDFVLLTFRRTQ